MSAARERNCLIAILLAAAVLRLAWLDQYPPPLHQDEASRGYDAWCMAQTGRDRWGESWPLFVCGFGPGDCTGALSMYLLVPLLRFFDPTVFLIRLPNALCSIATVAALWWLARRMFDARVGLLAALLLSVCPWHIALTRSGHNVAAVPFFLTVGLAVMAESGLPPLGERQGPRAKWALIAGLMLGLCGWAYHASTLFVAMLLAIFAVVFAAAWMALLRDRFGRRAMLAFFSGLVVGTLPLSMTMVRQPEKLLARAAPTAVWNAPVNTPRKVAWFVSNYVAEFSPVNLFFREQDIAQAGTNQRADYGRLLHVELLLLPVGVIVLLRRMRGERAARGLLDWLLLAPLPAAICGDANPHDLRALAAVPVLSLISAVGGIALLDRINERRLLMARLLVSVIAINAAWFPWRFAVNPPARAGDYNQENLRRAVQFAAARLPQCDFVWVTALSNQPYIQVLLAEPIRPGEFASAEKVVVPGPNGFHWVLRLNQWLFAPAYDRRDDLSLAALGAFRHELIGFRPEARGLAIDAPGLGPPGKVIERIMRDGNVDLEIREVRMMDVPLPPRRD